MQLQPPLESDAAALACCRSHGFGYQSITYLHTTHCLCLVVHPLQDVVPVRKQLSTYKDLRDVTATAKRTDGCAPDVQQSGVSPNKVLLGFS